MLFGIKGSGVEINVVSIEASGISLIDMSSISIQQNPLACVSLGGSEVTDCQSNRPTA